MIRDVLERLLPRRSSVQVALDYLAGLADPPPDRP